MTGGWGNCRFEGRPGVAGLPVDWGKWGGLPWGGGGLGFGFGELRYHAKLLHKAQSVPVDKTFRQLAFLQAGDGYSGNGEVLSGWRNPAEIPFMGAAAGPTGHDGFAFGNDVLDRQAKVGKSRAVESCPLLFTLRAAPKIGCRSVTMFVVGGKELVSERQVALVPNFFDETTDDSFVIFRHEVFLLFEKYNNGPRKKRVGPEGYGLEPLRSGACSPVRRTVG